MNPQTLAIPRGYILYDGGLTRKVSADWFDHAYWQQHAEVRPTSKGRGASWFIHSTEGDWVWRHYRRGGLVAKLFKDIYWWCGLARTRMWREWYLLHELVQRQLPVPQPIAARVVRSGVFYRGDILTQRIPAAQPLSQYLCHQALAHASWHRLGQLIRRLHTAGVSHADFNVHNILINNHDEFFVIDFDRGRLRAPASAWQRRMLERLHQSLQKLARQYKGFYYTEKDWLALLQGYEATFA